MAHLRHDTGSLPDERDRHRVGAHAWHATQRTAWEALMKAGSKN
jgi:hypothetical protein